MGSSWFPLVGGNFSFFEIFTKIDRLSTTLASASGDKTVIIWNLRSSKVGNALIRDLSLDELLTNSCAWIRNYLQNSPTLDPSDRALYNGINH